MADFLQGYFGTQPATVEAINDVTVAIRNWYPNRNPMFARLPHRPTGQVIFTTYTHGYRSGSTTLTAAVSTTTTTTIQVNDASFFLNHDLIEIVDAANGSEVVQVWSDTSQPGGVATTGSAGAYLVNVKRGLAGTTPITASNSDTCYVYSNARTGSEINQQGLSTIGSPHTQYTQTFQFPVQVGGSAESTTAQVFPGGIESPLDYNRQMQLQNMVDAIENTIYYGRAEAPTSTDTTTAKSDGIRNWLVTNKTTAPSDASAYTMYSLSRDLFQSPVASGGQPDLLVVSSDFMGAFQTWGCPLVRIPAGATELGVKVELFHAPFLNDINVVLAPLLRPKTAFSLTTAEVMMRPKRVPFYMPRGQLGDMFQGDWIAEVAIQIVNEQHHAWIEGITAFASN